MLNALNANRHRANVRLFLTEQHDYDESYTASEISITPRDSNNVTIAQPVSCSQCDTLSFVDPPANVDHFGVDVTLPNPQDTITLHTWSWD